MEIMRAFSNIVICVVLCMAAKSFAEPEKKSKEETLIELESYIVGDKEQPAVSYFVPWQGSSSPDKLHWNIEDKNDKTLDLVDREVMLRSMDIYEQLDLEAPVN